MTHEPNIVMLPGMGADGRMFDAQRRKFSELLSPDWLEPHDNETLATYGKRMAIAIEDCIDRSRPLVLGGVSFGGMVAQEVAKYLRPDRLILIATCSTPEAIPAFIRALEPVVRFIPINTLKWFTSLSPLLIKEFGDLSQAQRDALFDMFNDTSRAFLQWACHAVTRWEGIADINERYPVTRIHGERDPIIPIARVQPDVVIPGSGHLVNMTHWHEVNEAIERVLIARDDDM